MKVPVALCVLAVCAGVPYLVASLGDRVVAKFKLKQGHTIAEDLKYETVSAGSVDQCCYACSADVNCTAATYHRTQRTCSKINATLVTSILSMCNHQYCPADSGSVICELEQWKGPSNCLESTRTCFTQSDTKFTFDGAVDYCERRGGHLAIPKTQEEIDFVSSMPLTSSHYIGGYYDNQTLRWIDGTTMALPDEGKPEGWANAEPNLLNSNHQLCVVERMSGSQYQWNTEQCSSEEYALCEE